VCLQGTGLLKLQELNIPAFEREASTLQDFLQREKDLVGQLDAVLKDSATDKAVRQLLIGRVAANII
jgi:hypothetical protein